MSNPRMLLVLCVMMGSLLAGSASSEGQNAGANVKKRASALEPGAHILALRSGQQFVRLFEPVA
jgi:hypothetical protein